MTQPSFFRSRAYHMGMAVIYIMAGAILIIHNSGTDKTAIAGWLLVAYGLYRMVSRLRFKKEGNQSP